MGRRPCCSKDNVNKGAWSLQEDQILINYINTHGEGNWRVLPQKAGLNRCGKSCRLRWMNYLRPNIKRGDISKDEEDLIIRLHSLLGNRWSLIAGRLPGRTDNEIKNYWNTNLGKRFSTHKKPSPFIFPKKKRVKHDQVSKNNPNLVQTRPIHLSNRIVVENPVSQQQIGYEQLGRAMAYDKGQHSSNYTNTTTTSTPELEANDDPPGFLMDLDISNIDIVFEQEKTHAQTNNLDDYFPRNENDQMFNTKDVGDDPSKSLRSLPCSDPLIDANGIEIKIEEKVEEDQEITCVPSMEINLMWELKKMASFLDVDDEWNNM